MNIEYIDKLEQIPPLCHKIQTQSWIALDTEFLREKTYYPIFCLLQIATPEWVVCVDTIALPDLSQLLDTINNPKIIKVFHACRQDIEIFYQITGNVISPVFDTQIAAPLLGFPESAGYATLVASLLQVDLPKTHTRTNWSHRPLSQAQIQYAADDVIYLCKIYQIIRQQLIDLKRLAWLEEDFKLLENADLYHLTPANAWLKIKGKNKLTDAQLIILQALAAWREQTAQQKNQPKNWLLKDNILLELAKLKPTTEAELYQIRGIQSPTVRRYSNAICQLIIKTKNQPVTLLIDKTTITTTSIKKTQAQEAVLDVLTAIVRMRAAENSINPMVLASRKNIQKLLFAEDNLLLHGWRYSMVGQDLQAMLAGLYKITLDKERVVLSIHP